MLCPLPSKQYILESTPQGHMGTLLDPPPGCSVPSTEVQENAGKKAEIPGDTEQGRWAVQR